MAYDPTLPANNSPIVSQELRDQFNGLKALIDAQQAEVDQKTSQDDVVQLINDRAAHSCSELAGWGITVSDPPTAAEVQQMADQLGLLISSLVRSQ
jgi:hypothetical protein